MCTMCNTHLRAHARVPYKTRQACGEKGEERWEGGGSAVFIAPILTIPNCNVRESNPGLMGKATIPNCNVQGSNPGLMGKAM